MLRRNSGHDPKSAQCPFLTQAVINREPATREEGDRGGGIDVRVRAKLIQTRAATIFTKARPDRRHLRRRSELSWSRRLRPSRYRRWSRGWTACLHEFRGRRGNSIELAVGPSVRDRHVLVFAEACFLKSLPECTRLGRVSISSSIDEESRSPASPAAREPHRRYRRAAKQRDELAPLHSITSSTPSRIDRGNSRPSAFAVFRFTRAQTSSPDQREARRACRP